MPDMPTIEEAGVGGYELSSWYGILAAAGTLDPTMGGSLLHNGNFEYMDNSDAKTNARYHDHARRSLYLPVVRRIGPGKAAYSSVLVPIIAMSFSTWLEGYRWTPTAIAGAVLVVIGSTVADLLVMRLDPRAANDEANDRQHA
jgi:hypothetical protein